MQRVSSEEARLCYVFQGIRGRNALQLVSPAEFPGKRCIIWLIQTKRVATPAVCINKTQKLLVAEDAKKTLLDMSDTSREEKTLTLSARTSGKETQEKKNDSSLCFFMWKMLVAKMNEENIKRWKGGQDMPDFETSREEKTLTFSARAAARETQQKEGQHFVLLCMFKCSSQKRMKRTEENAGRGVRTCQILRRAGKKKL